jgi:hypothetical protein
MRIFVLGVGATGSLIAKLLQRQGHHVVCGDRDPSRARAFLGERPLLAIQKVNARRVRDVVKAARGCDLLINTCPAVYNKTILRAALRLHAHYLDTASHLRQSPFRPEQFGFDGHFRRIGRTALIQAGAAPGLTNVLAAQATASLHGIDTIKIRLFEGTNSENPVSQWSAEASFDEATSKPRVYRDRKFLFGKRFGEHERFRFAPPIGVAAVVLAAQDEVVTFPHFFRIRDMDVKIGGPDVDRLRRWFRQGKLNRSGGLIRSRFPATPTPRLMTHLVRRGVLRNARFGIAVLVYGRVGQRSVLIRWDAAFPSLFDLRRRRISCSPIAWATAQMAVTFVKHFPRETPGVVPPETLPAGIRGKILSAARSRGIRLSRRLVHLKTPIAHGEHNG